jgi:CelD/BcsL family acetyltransferase involved in cellulose biosynthesis
VTIAAARYTVQCVDTTQALQALRPAWQALDIQDIGSAFLSWEWLSAWWGAYGEGKQLRVYTAWLGESLAGVAPLMLERRTYNGIRLRVLRSLGAPDIDIGGWLARGGEAETASNGVVEALLQAVLGDRREWDLLELNQLWLDAPMTGRLIPALRAAGCAVEVRPERHLALPVTSDWVTYFQGLSKNLRDDLRKKERRAEKHGALVFERRRGREVTPAHLAALFALNARGRYPQLYRSPAEQAFQRALLDSAAARGWADLSTLSIEGQPVAYRYGFSFDNRFEDWRTGFDTGFFELSVGKLLLMRLLQDCFQRGYREIDFLRGDEGYKERWNAQERLYGQIRAVPRTRLLVGAAALWLPGLKRWLKRFLGQRSRSSPASPSPQDSQDFLA